MKEIGYSELEALFTAALASLESRKAFINSLNVFPVPDGDTGTNMSLTLRTALEEVQKSHPKSMKEFVSTLSAGSLIGARGNSGVILSQIIRGMAAAADSKSELTTTDFTQMLAKATEVAYKAVVTPVEGTILTVVRRMAESAAGLHEKDYTEYLAEVIRTGRQAVKETTAQLPALAEAHVVDAGAEGLVTLLEGMLMSLRGESVASRRLTLEGEPEEHVGPQELTYRYDTVILVASDTLPEAEVRSKLTERGDSLVMASAGGLTKIHVHTNEPYDAIQYLMKFAPIREGRIEDMQYQANEYIGGRPSAVNTSSQPLASAEGCPGDNIDRAYVVVSPGPGFDEIFRKLGAQIIVGGGDTMNPPTEAFLDPIKRCSARSFMIFPNNKNIIMAAQQAASLIDKNVQVLNAYHPVQAIAALVQLASCGPDDDCMAVANQAIDATDFFAVTRATRNATVAGLLVHEGDYMLLVDDKLVGLGQSVEEALRHLRKSPIAWDDKSLVSVYRGVEFTEASFDALVVTLTEQFSDLEIQSYYGGQAFYDAVGSVE
ncbi:MAG: DAK2 domain-containing protein [Caldiserica bacterium]|nr:DAK2 domain-containing protein [Caldisericota bacterium]